MLVVVPGACDVTSEAQLVFHPMWHALPPNSSFSSSPYPCAQPHAQRLTCLSKLSFRLKTLPAALQFVFEHTKPVPFRSCLEFWWRLRSALSANAARHTAHWKRRLCLRFTWSLYSISTRSYLGLERRRTSMHLLFERRSRNI
jgi:hypothetical protein